MKQTEVLGKVECRQTGFERNCVGSLFILHYIKAAE